MTLRDNGKGFLNNEINKLQTEITLKQTQIEQTALEIQSTEQKIQTAENDITQQKERLAGFIREIYKQDKKTFVELALTVNNFSDYYNYLYTLEKIQNNTKKILNELKKFKADLEIHIANLEKKKRSIEKLIQELDNKKVALASNTHAKQNLLDESRNSESKFQSLVNRLKTEQSEINADIISLEKQIRSKLGGNARFESLSSSDFIWPVHNRGITAYFHDPSYPFRYIFEHPAIDIKSSQGSPIKAANSGYVGKVVINGTKYGYIMLIHGNGFSTVYGHTTKSYVTEDQYVAKGEIIGLSGGMPGTPGAGNLSTGPHLHFEIRKNGIPVNPLDYLP
mgnify:CR=1 FL=1